MFFVRIVFYIENNYDVDIDDEKVLFVDEQKKCIFKMDRRYGDKKAIITYGAFAKREDAEEKGRDLFNNVKRQFAKNEIPINISGGLGVLDTNRVEMCTGTLTEYGKKNINQLLPNLDTKGKIIEDEALGMRIHEVREDISEYIFITQKAIIQRKMDCVSITNERVFFDEKLGVAYSLMSSSNLINDIRIAFILKISAIEALVSDKEYKDSVYCSIIKCFSKKYVKFENVDDDLKENNTQDFLETIIQKMKCDIGELKIKAIGEKCSTLIKEANLNKRYTDQNATEFFKKCYAVRSGFVHAGKSDIQFIQNNISELHKLVVDILEYYEKKLSSSK